MSDGGWVAGDAEGHPASSMDVATAIVDLSPDSFVCVDASDFNHADEQPGGIAQALDRD
ncbi:MAG TPA: hypothetical protein VN886_15030 [Acidimicrobiales bacterium]|jgi:hypothetical protein|nr:hypothetical protein [Acidimicrobiales bacterium]